MSRRRHSVLLCLAALVGLLSLAHLQAAAHSREEFPRFFTSSWDKPTCHIVEELVSELIPRENPALQNGDHVLEGYRSEVRLALQPQVGSAGTTGIDSRLTRSPPLV